MQKAGPSQSARPGSNGETPPDSAEVAQAEQGHDLAIALLTKDTLRPATGFQSDPETAGRTVSGLCCRPTLSPRAGVPPTACASAHGAGGCLLLSLSLFSIRVRSCKRIRTRASWNEPYGAHTHRKPGARRVRLQENCCKRTGDCKTRRSPETRVLQTVRSRLRSLSPASRPAAGVGTVWGTPSSPAWSRG